MTIPLDLSVRIHAMGLESLSSVQNAIVGTGEAARSKAAVGLRELTRSFQEVLQGSELLVPELTSIIGGLNALSRYAGLIAPSSLNEFADMLMNVRQRIIESSWAFTEGSMRGAAMEQIVEELTDRERLLVDAVMNVANALRNQAAAMRVTTQTTMKGKRAIEKTTAATRRMGKQARMTALTGMNVLSSATQGVMMAMGLLQGNLMSVGFGLIFLRYSIAPLTLSVAGLVAAIGGTLKAITFVGPAFEKLVTGPMNKMKAAVVEVMGYFSGAVWVRIIAPSLRILADLAERFRDLALQTWLSAEVQRSWGELLGMVQGTFQNLSRAIKEHGGILRWVVRTGFIMAINVLKGIIYLINVAIEVLPQMAYMWQRLSGDLKNAWATLGLVAQGLKELGLEGVLQKVKEFALDVTLEEILLLTLGVLTGKTKAAILLAAGVFLADLMAEFLGFDEELREKWRTLWDWVAVGAFVGFSIAGPKGAIIGALLGGIIGLFVAFRDELQTLAFDMAATVDKMFSSLIGPLMQIEDALDIVGRGIFPESVEDSIKKWRESSAEFQRLHELWRVSGRPILEGWSGQWEDLREAVKGASLEMVKGRAQDPAQLAQIQRNWERMWREMIVEGAAGPGTAVGASIVDEMIAKSHKIGAEMMEEWRSFPPPTDFWELQPWGGPFLPTMMKEWDGGTIVNVTITGNNMYGKLSDEDARIWAQQIGYHTMSRLSTRKGIGIR